jgi:hypothetical protein
MKIDSDNSEDNFEKETEIENRQVLTQSIAKLKKITSESLQKMRQSHENLDFF